MFSFVSNVLLPTGESLTISHNVLDVSSSLEVTQFSQMTIKCNVILAKLQQQSDDCNLTSKDDEDSDTQIIYGKMSQNKKHVLLYDI